MFVRLHSQATMTPKLRAIIQASSEPLMYPTFVKVLPMRRFAKRRIGRAYTVNHLWGNHVQ